MQTIITINEQYSEDLNKLERACIEVTVRENILQLMIKNNQKKSEKYKQIWKEYIKYLKDYIDIKNIFYYNCILNLTQKDNIVSWTIDFDRREVILNE